VKYIFVLFRTRAKENSFHVPKILRMVAVDMMG
jgi:hypothetical protein